MKLAKQKNLLKAENKRYGKLLFKEYFLSHDINKFRYNAAKVTAYYISLGISLFVNAMW